jgi:Tfp pilus assembly protein PilX
VSDRARRSQQGSALLVAVLLLVMMGLIGFAALEAVSRDRQVTGFLNRKKLAFYAAEGGVAEALESLRNDLEPTVTATSLADTATYPHGRPSYRADPAVADAIDNVGFGGAPGMNLQIGQGGAPMFQVSFWRVNVQGDAPGGSMARLEVTSGALIAN